MARDWKYKMKGVSVPAYYLGDPKPEGDLTFEVDWDKMRDVLGCRAAKNTSRQCVGYKGAIRAVWKPQREKK